MIFDYVPVIFNCIQKMNKKKRMRKNRILTCFSGIINRSVHEQQLGVSAKIPCHY